MFLSHLLYMILVSVVSAALFHVLVHHIEETVVTAYYCSTLYMSQKNCANLFFAPCLSNMNRFQ